MSDSVVVPSTYRVLPAGYADAPLIDKSHFEVEVAWRGTDEESGTDQWAVLHGGRCLSVSGEWEHEPMPSSRSADFLTRCRFDREEALARAQAVVNEVRINGATMLEWSQRVREAEGRSHAD